MEFNQNQYLYQQEEHLTKPMSFGDWMKTMLLMLIPVANIILLFVWAFGDGVNINKKNFSKAYLIFVAIGFVLSFVFFFLFAVLIASMPELFDNASMNNGYNNDYDFE